MRIYVDEKVTVWVRHHYEISEEEKKEIKNNPAKDVLDKLDSLGSNHLYTETLMDTMSQIVDNTSNVIEVYERLDLIEGDNKEDILLISG